MQKAEDIRIRDPFVFVEDGEYYLLGTTGNDCWDKGSDLTLYSSKDLVCFERVGCMVGKDALADYTQIWAPELHKYCGKYYLIVSVFQKSKGRGSIILVSDTLKEKFQPLTGNYITPEDWWCLDATLFIWKEKPYLIFSNEWINPVTGDGDGSLFVAELAADLKALAGKPRKIISGKYCGFSRADGERRNNGVCRGRSVRDNGGWTYRLVLVNLYRTRLLRRKKQGGGYFRGIYFRKIYFPRGRRPRHDF